MTRPYPSCCRFLFCLALALPCMGVAFAQEPKANDVADDYGRYLASMPAAASAAEADLHELIKKAQHEGRAAGVRSQLEGVEWQVMSLSQMIMRALSHNLDLRRSRLREDFVDAALTEARSLFDPVFSLSADYTRVASYNRIEHDKKHSEGTGDYVDANGNTVENAQPVPEGPVEYFQFNIPRPEGDYDARIIANEEFFTGPSETRNYNLGVSQGLPWGMDLDLGLGLINRETYFINNYGSRYAGLASYGSYNRPWTAFFNMDFSAPLPWSRDAGSDARRDSRERQALLDRDKAAWEVREIINTTLARVDYAFWDLVYAVHNIRLTRAHLKLIEQLQGKTARMFELGRITAAQKAQMDSEREQVRVLYEKVWLDYILTVNRIRQLLAQKENIAILPAAYTDLLSDIKQTAIPGLVSTDVQQHPLVRVAEYERRMQQEELRQKEQDARPDLKLEIGYTAAQNGSRFGYESAGEALGNVADPDYVSNSYSLVYVYPWGNRAVEARELQARANFDKSVLARELSIKTVNRDRNDSALALSSAWQRLELMKKNQELSRYVLDKAMDLQKSRGVTEYELVVKGRNLLLAERQLQQSMVGLRKAWTSYLAADGKLAPNLAMQSGVGEAGARALVWFGGEQ